MNYDFEFWASVAGETLKTEGAATLFGLLGVLIGLLHAERSSTRALREERRKDREKSEFDLKKDALLTAHSAIVDLMGFFGRIPSIDSPSLRESTAFADASKALGRLHFFCTEKTIDTAIRLNAVIAESYIEMMKVKLPWQFTESDKQLADGEYTGLEKIKTALAEAVSTSAGTDRIHLQKQLAEVSQKIAAVCAKRADLAQKHFEQTVECSTALGPKLILMNGVIAEVLICARNELNFPIDGEKYVRVIQEQNLNALKALEDFNSFVRSEVQKRTD